MQITTTARHFELTPALKDHIEDRVSRLTRYSEQLIRGHVTLSVQKHEHLAEVSMHGNGVDFIGHGKSEDMYVSVDLAVDKLERQLKKYKEKIRNHKGRTSLVEGFASSEEEEEETETEVTE